MSNMIEVTNVDLKQFVKDVYDLSVPQGLGFLHSTDGPLSDSDAEKILSYGDERIAVRMDYIHGRSCKMNVFKENGKLFINKPWYDHSDSQLAELLKRHDIPFNIENNKHGSACNCGDCRISQGKTEIPEPFE